MRTLKAGLRPRSRLAHAGTRRTEYGETSEPLFLTQSFAYSSAAEAERLFAQGDGYVYSRHGNPTVDMFVDRLADYEGAEAGCAFATGMAAVTAALLSQLSAGDHVVASRMLFGSCRYVLTDLLPRLGIDTTLVDGVCLDDWVAAVRPNTRLFFLETPANPTLEVLSIESIAQVARQQNIHLAVDGALASSVVQRPLDLGANSVIHSATKHIDGQGRCLGGAVLGSRQFIDKYAAPFQTHTGGSLSPFNAWALFKSLETLELRVAAQSENAQTIALAAEEYGDGITVRYPGLESHPQHEVAKRQMRGGGTLLTLDFAKGKKAAFRFLDALELVVICNNFGDSRTLAVHPATTTHQRLDSSLRRDLGISDGLVRVSAGLEDSKDLVEDLLCAIHKAKGDSP